MLVALVMACGWPSGPVTLAVTRRGRSRSRVVRNSAESAVETFPPGFLPASMMTRVSPVVPEVWPLTSTSPVSASLRTTRTGAV